MGSVGDECGRDTRSVSRRALGITDRGVDQLQGGLDVTLQPIQYAPDHKWDHQFVVTGKLDSDTSGLGWTLDDVDPGAIVPLHVEIGGQKMSGAAVIQITGNGQCLEEHLRHDHGTPAIEDGATLVQAGKTSCQPAKIPVRRVAEGSAIGGGMLVNDLCADRRMDRNWDVPLMAGKDDRYLSSDIAVSGRQEAAETFAQSLAGGRSLADRCVHFAASFLRHAE